MQRRKIYYVPGLISLVILLPLLYEFLQKERARHDYRVMEVIMADPAYLSKDPFYNKLYPTYPPSRDYLTFELTGNAVHDKIKLDYAQLRIREIETTGERVHGVNFHFNDSAKYRSFVRALDILSQENATRYMAAHKNIWFWAEPKPTMKPEPLLLCGCCPGPFSEAEILPEDHLEKIFTTLKNYWPITLIFTGLMLCAVRFTLRRRPAAVKLVRVLSEVRGRQ